MKKLVILFSIAILFTFSLLINAQQHELEHAGDQEGSGYTKSYGNCYNNSGDWNGNSVTCLSPGDKSCTSRNC
ncbi:hypothetical protein [Carboxylicivirga sp. N1Y90]|uniref:hypothetical protein n=1 Tax=Carboxylicivirga fragile TaxID=3417571 RepID=UPI003D34C6BA|nr:hypothetical protein [Marinilabiliaceae bacterium N1Y90]